MAFLNPARPALAKEAILGGQIGCWHGRPAMESPLKIGD